MSDQRNDPAGLVLGHLSSGRTLFFAGRFVPSRSHLEEVLPLYDPNSHGMLVQQAALHPQVISLAVLGNVLFCLGYPDRALIQSSAAVAEAQKLVHPPSLGVSLAIGARVLSLLGHNTLLAEWVDQLTTVTTAQGFAHWGAQGTIYDGWVKVKNDDVIEGLSLLRRGSIAYRATGARGNMPYHINLLASTYETVGQIGESLTLLDEAIEIVGATGERWFAAELNRHKGELLLQQGHPEAAEKLYRRALGVAVEQEAKLWELHAVVSLARLRRDQGRRAEAHDLLAPVYGWFTEGFDTPDLKEAKELLEGLT